MNSAIKWVLAIGVWLGLMIVGYGIMLALERRNFRPAQAIARFLSPDSAVVALNEG